MRVVRRAVHRLRLFGRADRRRADGNKVSLALDTTLRSAASTARSTGVKVTYVSPYNTDGSVRASFAGHSLCEAQAPYYRGLEALAPGQEGQDVVLHPNAAGQAAIADLIECAAVPARRH